MSEIIATGEFAATPHPAAIAFRGQLKNGIQVPAAAATFWIATLIDRPPVLAAMTKLRAHPRIQALADLTPDEINSHLNISVRLDIKQHFADTAIMPILNGEKAVSAHNRRGVYAEITVHFFCPPHQGTHRFLQQHLDHIIGESELARRKNAGATEHYFHYYLVGDQGQPLGEKGILIDRVGALPPTIPAIAAPPPATTESTPAPAQEVPAVPTTPKPPTTKVPMALMHELKEVAAAKIMSWNDDPNHEFGQKWVISVPVLQQLLRGSGYSASQARVQAAITHRRSKIDAHHHQHGLGQRHNVHHLQPITENIVMSRKDKFKTTSIKAIGFPRPFRVDATVPCTRL